MSQLAVGTLADPNMLTGPYEDRRRLLGRAADGGLDHVFVADHVSFFHGLVSTRRREDGEPPSP